MELCEAHWRGQNAAAQGRTVKGQDRGAVGQHQERAPTCPVILPSTNCRLYYRLLSNGPHDTARALPYRINDEAEEGARRDNGGGKIDRGCAPDQSLRRDAA